MTRLSVKALRHHDELGLLVPHEVYLDDPRTVGAETLRTRIEWPVETGEGASE
jgi:hypothetical protein